MPGEDSKSFQVQFLLSIQDGATAVLQRIQGQAQGVASALESAGTKATASLAAPLTGLQQGFSQMGSAAATGIQSITSGLDPLKGTLDVINAGVSSIQGNISKISGGLGALVAAVPVMAGLGAASMFMSKSLRDAGKETQNLIAVQATWKALGRGTEEEMQNLIEKTKDLSRTSSYASQDVIAGMKFLAGFPSVATKDLLPALQTAIDFAAYQNVGIQEATRILGFAATGRTAWLEHFYGFKFSEATKQSKDFSKILAEMQARVSGQEAAKMETYAGAVGALEKAFNRVEKAIGHVLEAAIVPVLKDLVGYFSAFGKSVEDAFKAGATEEWQERFRGVFEGIADYTKGVFDGIRNFATGGGFDRIFAAVQNVMSIMQALIGLAGKLVGWLVLLPKGVWEFIAASLGLAAIVKIVGTMWGGWRALWQTITGGKAIIADYSAKALAWLNGEKVAVDAVTAAYQRRNAAAAGGAIPAAGGAKSKTGPSTEGTYGGSYVPTLLGGPIRTPPIVPEGPAGMGGRRIGVGLAGMGAGAAIGYATGGVEGAAIGAGLGGIDLLIAGLAKLKPLASSISDVFKVFFGNLRGGLGILASARTLLSGLGVVISGITAPIWALPAAVAALTGGGFYLWATKWSEAAGIIKDKTGEAQRNMQKMVDAGYQPKERITKVTEKQIAGMSAEDRKALRDAQMQDLTYETEKYQQLVMQHGVNDDQVVAERKKLSILRDNLQTIREAQKAQADAKAPETVNLLEDVKAIREKHKLIMDLAKSEYEEKKLYLQLELAERKAVIAETIKSTILQQQAIAQAEQEISAQRMRNVVAHYEETKRLQEEGYAEERNRILQNLNGSNPTERQKAVKDLAKLDRDYAKEQVDTAKQTTAELEKELQKQYEQRAQLNRKIQALEVQAGDAQRSTAQALRGIEEAAASEYDKLWMKLDDARAKLDEATTLMPTFPEKALSLAKEAQGAFAGLAQNIDSLQMNIRNSQQLIDDALRSIDQSRLTGVAKWRAEMDNLRTDMQRAQALAGEGRYKEAEAAYKKVVSGATAANSSAPQGMKGYAAEEAKSIIMQVRSELSAMQSKQLAEAEAANKEAKAGAGKAGDTIQAGIEQQLIAAKQNLEALNANTRALQDLLKRLGGEEAAARSKAGEEIKKMNEPQPVPKQGEAQGEANLGNPLEQDELNKALTDTGKTLETSEAKNNEIEKERERIRREQAAQKAPGLTPEDKEREAAAQAGAIIGSGEAQSGFGGFVSRMQEMLTGENLSALIERAMGSARQNLAEVQTRMSDAREALQYGVQDKLDRFNAGQTPAQGGAAASGEVATAPVKDFIQGMKEFGEAVREHARNLREPIEVRAQVGQEFDQFVPVG